ncbi:hypothetical protein CC78DRAFT_57362 [Lojkania enalia]|uniref:SP-RING-type domain-containing protein n=1 Tax=Lojkania enalia TaxID=147567 RepID=A0A9P4K3L2_9PLEO|nr:hypothetical protein CC78DRAFT_57362 [Didymosphaeria enalia]
MTTGRPLSNPNQHAARMAAIEAAQQQHTLNHALGNLGGRQKTWMAMHAPKPPAHAPSGSKPNPPTRSQTDPHPRPPQQPAAAPTSPTTEDDREIQPPSNSTSPQLANILSRPLRASPLLCPNSILPSPAPSEENNVDLAPTHAVSSSNAYTQHEENRETAIRNLTVDRRGDPQLQCSAGTNQISEQPAHSSKRSFANCTAEANKRIRVENRSAEVRLPQPHAATERAESSPELALRSNNRQPAISRAGSIQQEQSRSQPLSPQVHQAMEVRPQVYPQQGQTPPQTQHPFGSSRVLANNLNLRPAPLLPINAPAMPAQHSPVSASPHLPSDYFTHQECKTAFDTFVSTHRPMPRHPRDASRLGVLRDAIDKQDWAYLTLHQYYCLFTTNQQLIPKKILSNPNLNSALRLLQEVLDSNSTLSSEVMHFFANFPYPLTQISLNWPRRYEQEQQMFLNFMVYSANFDTLKAVCAQRKCPPLPRDLFHDLGIASLVFQRIVFTAVLRRIWGAWAPTPQPAHQSQFEESAIKLFLQSQEDFEQQERNRPLNATLEYEQQKRLAEQQNWGVPLRALCENYEACLRNQGSQQPHQAHLAPVSVLQWQQQQPPHRQVHPDSQQPSLYSQAIPQSGQVRRGRGRGRPRIYPLPPQQVSFTHPPPPPPRQPHDLHLLPPKGLIRPQPVHPNPSKSALHQAYLRSPILRPQLANAMLYQYVKGFAIPPARLEKAGERIEKWTLSMSSEDIRSVPTDVPGHPGDPPSRIIYENSQLFRLRCIKWPAEAKLPNEHSWAVADTTWIPYTYFTFNGVDLHPRKKLHHGKDLPIDLSGLVREGDNALQIAVLRRSSDDTYRNFLLAIEIVGTTEHRTITKSCLSMNRIPSARIIDAIKSRLSGSDDDEIAIVQSNLTINLFDPFSASKVCDIPARSRACLHNDCFDLDTFLTTRKRKHGSSVVDHWRCPICNGDARPQYLIVDGFLQEVRKYLEQRGILQTRAIVVDQTGEWKPKDGAQQRETPDKSEQPQHTTITSTSNMQMAPMGIIDISD